MGIITTVPREIAVQLRKVPLKVPLGKNSKGSVSDLGILNGKEGLSWVKNGNECKGFL